MITFLSRAHVEQFPINNFVGDVTWRLMMSYTLSHRNTSAHNQWQICPHSGRMWAQFFDKHLSLQKSWKKAPTSTHANIIYDLRNVQTSGLINRKYTLNEVNVECAVLHALHNIITSLTALMSSATIYVYVYCIHISYTSTMYIVQCTYLQGWTYRVDLILHFTILIIHIRLKIVSTIIELPCLQCTPIAIFQSRTFD